MTAVLFCHERRPTERIGSYVFCTPRCAVTYIGTIVQSIYHIKKTCQRLALPLPFDADC